MVKTNFYIPVGTAKALRWLADRRTSSVADIVRTALREYLKREVANERGQLADRDP